MENCTIYSHLLDFDLVESIIKKHLPKASVERQDLEGEKIISVQSKKGFLSRKQTATIKCRQRVHPSYVLERAECPLSQNLIGMQNYVASLAAQNGTIQSLLSQKIATLNSEISFMVKPYISEDFEKILQEILQELDGILFTPPTGLFSKSEHQQFLDKNFDLILDTAGASELSQLDVVIESKYYDQPKATYTEAQLERKLNSETILKKHQVKINTNLPCTKDIEQIKLKSKEAILDRIYALTIITARAEGVPLEQLQKVIADKEITLFSPYENHVLSNEIPADELSVLTWRYESLFLLCWAVNKIETLPYPSDMCPVDEFLGVILKQSRTEFNNGASLRTKKEIVAVLDLIYRMNWACVDARINNEPVSGNLHPGIVYERHYTLNWLTNHRNQTWDDITTDT